MQNIFKIWSVTSFEEYLNDFPSIPGKFEKLTDYQQSLGYKTPKEFFDKQAYAAQNLANDRVGNILERIFMTTDLTEPVRVQLKKFTYQAIDFLRMNDLVISEDARVNQTIKNNNRSDASQMSINRIEQFVGSTAWRSWMLANIEQLYFSWAEKNDIPTLLDPTGFYNKKQVDFKLGEIDDQIQVQQEFVDEKLEVQNDNVNKTLNEFKKTLSDDQGFIDRFADEVLKKPELPNKTAAILVKNNNFQKDLSEKIINDNKFQEENAKNLLQNQAFKDELIGGINIDLTNEITNLKAENKKQDLTINSKTNYDLDINKGYNGTTFNKLQYTQSESKMNVKDVFNPSFFGKDEYLSIAWAKLIIKNTNQDTKITIIESKNIEQDGKISILESKVSTLEEELKKKLELIKKLEEKIKNAKNKLQQFNSQPTERISVNDETMHGILVWDIKWSKWSLLEWNSNNNGNILTTHKNMYFPMDRNKGIGKYWYLLEDVAKILDVVEE